MMTIRPLTLARVNCRREQKAKIYSEEPNISWGSKIRNYTILRNAVKDFRTGLEIKDCHKVFSGEGLHQFMEEILVSCSEKRHLSISKNI